MAMPSDLAAIIRQAVTDADHAATQASRQLARQADRLRSAGATIEQFQSDQALGDAGRASMRATAAADGIRSLANRLLVELGEQPIPHPGDPGRPPTKDDGEETGYT
jgi:hypothetical protein